jgi:hypothetical protein
MPVAQLPSGEIIGIGRSAGINAFGRVFQRRTTLAPHPNERSKPFLGPPLLTPRPAHARQGPATGGEDLLLLTVTSFGKLGFQFPVRHQPLANATARWSQSFTVCVDRDGIPPQLCGPRPVF